MVDTEIVPGRIYHDSSVLKQRLIFDGGKRNFTIFEQLRQRFKSVDISRVISVFQLNPILINVDFIRLGFHVLEMNGWQPNMNFFIEDKLPGAFDIFIQPLQDFGEVVAWLYHWMFGGKVEQIAYICKLELSLVVLLKDRRREDLSVDGKCYDTQDDYFVHDTIINIKRWIRILR